MARSKSGRFTSRSRPRRRSSGRRVSRSRGKGPIALGTLAPGLYILAKTVLGGGDSAGGVGINVTGAWPKLKAGDPAGAARELIDIPAIYIVGNTLTHNGIRNAYGFPVKTGLIALGGMAAHKVASKVGVNRGVSRLQRLFGARRAMVVV